MTAPDDMPLPADDLLQTIAGWGAAGIALVTSGALLRKRLSRDHVERSKDRAESSFIEILLKERDEALDDARRALAEAREAWQARRVDAEAIARLTAENEHQAEEIARLTSEFTALKRMIVRMYPDTKPMLDSNFSPLTEG